MLDSETPIDLLFTDVIMPGRVKGGELDAVPRCASRRCPCCSRPATRDEIFHAGRLDPGVMLLGKPYRRDELAARIRSALDAGAGTT